MISKIRSMGAKSLILFSLLPLLILSACGGTTGSSGGGGSSGSGSGGARGTITVASKFDTESQLITEMYSQLLTKAGFTVNEKLALGNTPTVFSALQSGSIDLYPEFTATGLNKLQVQSSHDPQKDYQTVKDGFEKNYKITWLDASPLNDGYAICTTKDNSQKFGITKLSEITGKTSQYALASPSDGIDFVDGLKSVYNFDTKSFKQLEKVDYAIGFTAVKNNQAQFNVCYTTDGTVATQNFTFLQDDKNGFPQFNPAPIVRDSVLAKYPDIKTALNPLAPKLTTDVSIDLQNKVAQKKKNNESAGQAVKEVATDFLKSQGLV